MINPCTNTRLSVTAQIHGSFADKSLFSDTYKMINRERTHFCSIQLKDIGQLPTKYIRACKDSNNFSVTKSELASAI